MRLSDFCDDLLGHRLSVEFVARRAILYGAGDAVCFRADAFHDHDVSKPKWVDRQHPYMDPDLYAVRGDDARQR